MKYIYTSPDCPNCETLKNSYKKNKNNFEERSSDRIKNPQDFIDQEMGAFDYDKEPCVIG